MQTRGEKEEIWHSDCRSSSGKVHLRVEKLDGNYRQQAPHHNRGDGNIEPEDVKQHRSERLFVSSRKSWTPILLGKESYGDSIPGLMVQSVIMSNQPRPTSQRLQRQIPLGP